ncbi:hypothetical protein [Acetobacter sicerae]|uniref:hypothetical protein n=1 Tax=Acetobacter sicerae TaxID=85325 RepID=UPI00156B2F78|nr:hypothetical protein [Acetobacter sicerae]NHN93396.1 hypothetical protein [Acetobacter sicerae]
MKQSTRDALQSFLDSRLCTDVITDVWKLLDECVDVRQSEGKDAPELALRTSELLALLEEDLTPDEYDRAKGLVLQDQSPAMDAAIRVIRTNRDHQSAINDVKPLLGDEVIGMDSAEIYRAGLEQLGVNAAQAPLDAARAMFRQMGRGRGKQNMPIAPDSPISGRSARLKA